MSNALVYDTQCVKWLWFSLLYTNYASKSSSVLDEYKQDLPTDLEKPDGKKLMLIQRLPKRERKEREREEER